MITRGIIDDRRAFAPPPRLASSPPLFRAAETSLRGRACIDAIVYRIPYVTACRGARLTFYRPNASVFHDAGDCIGVSLVCAMFAVLGFLKRSRLAEQRELTQFAQLQEEALPREHGKMKRGRGIFSQLCLRRETGRTRMRRNKCQERSLSII